MDFQTGKISNRLIVSGLIWGLAFRLMGDGMAGVLPFLIHISIPVILFILLFQIRAIGAGDIKLFSVVGGFLSIRQLVYLVLTAFVVAAGIGVLKLFYQQDFDPFFNSNFNRIFYCSLGVGHCVK